MEKSIKKLSQFLTHGYILVQIAKSKTVKVE